MVTVQWMLLLHACYECGHQHKSGGTNVNHFLYDHIAETVKLAVDHFRWYQINLHANYLYNETQTS